MKKLVALSFAFLFLVGCDNEEQKAQIEEQKAQIIELEAEIVSLKEELSEKNNKEEDLQIIKSYLDRLDAPVTRFKTGVSYRDFSGIHSQIDTVIAQYGRDDIAEKYPDILTIMDEIESDLDSISLVYGYKFGGSSVSEFINAPDYLIEKYKPSPINETEYGWYADGLLTTIFGSVSSNTDTLWDKYKDYKK